VRSLFSFLSPLGCVCLWGVFHFSFSFFNNTADYDGSAVPGDSHLVPLLMSIPLHISSNVSFFSLFFPLFFLIEGRAAITPPSFFPFLHCNNGLSGLSYSISPFFFFPVHLGLDEDPNYLYTLPFLYRVGAVDYLWGVQCLTFFFSHLEKITSRGCRKPPSLPPFYSPLLLGKGVEER